MEVLPLNRITVRHLIDNYESYIAFVMDYVEQNKHILNCTLDSLGREHLRQFYYSDLIMCQLKLHLIYHDSYLQSFLLLSASV